MTFNQAFGRVLARYRVTVMRYAEHSRSWKTVETWERYWQEMNALEDLLDKMISRANYEGVTIKHWDIYRYELSQKSRANTTARCPF